MNIETIVIELSKTFAGKKANLENITLHSKFKEDLHLDSLSLTEFVIACEDAFKIEIDLDDPRTANAKELHELVDAIKELVK
jgi:acyl carrier protein